MLEQSLSQFINDNWNKIENQLDQNSTELKFTESQIFPSKFRKEVLSISREQSSKALENLALSSRKNINLSRKIEENLGKPFYSLRIKPLVRIENVLQDFYNDIFNFFYEEAQFYFKDIVYTKGVSHIIVDKSAINDEFRYQKRLEVYLTIRSFKVNYHNFSDSEIRSINSEFKSFLRDRVLRFISDFFETKTIQKIEIGIFDLYSNSFIHSVEVKTVFDNKVANDHWRFNRLDNLKKKCTNANYHFSEYGILKALYEKFEKLPLSLFEIKSSSKPLYMKESSASFKDFGSLGKEEIWDLLKIYKEARNKDLLNEIEFIISEVL